MHIATMMTMLVTSLALGACNAREEAAEMPEASAETALGENMPMDAGDMPMTTSADAPKVARAEGTVTAIDGAEGTVTINHGAVPAVNWPAMTMAFEAEKALRDQIAVGNAVTFEFRTSEAGNEIVSIRQR